MLGYLIRVRSLLLNLVWGNIKSGLDITKLKLNKKCSFFFHIIIRTLVGEEEKEKNVINALPALSKIKDVSNRQTKLILLIRVIIILRV